MKKNSKILIYDDDCPLCAAYTIAFVKTGLLSEEGRKSFNNIDAANFAWIDKNKCHNEIPLIDTQTKQVWYGIDALLEILDQKIPFIKYIGNIKPIKWFLQKLYRFISYNRKVIVAKTSKTNYDCSPDFNSRYRICFLAVFFLFNTAMLFPLYQTIFSHSFIGHSSYLQLQAAHLLLVASNICCTLVLKNKIAIEFLGQVNMLALLSILMLIPLHLVNKYFLPLQNVYINLYLFLLSIFILQQYIKRMKYAGIIGRHNWVPAVNLLSLLAFIIYLII